MKTIVVATNPYRHVDHLKRPCAACPADFKDPRYFDPAKDRNVEVRGWVGARLPADPPLLRKGGGKGAGPADPSQKHDVTFEFRFAPFEIPETRFYLDRLREEALLPADEATANTAKVAFRPVEKAREAARKASGSDQPVQWIDPPEIKVTVTNASDLTSVAWDVTATPRPDPSAEEPEAEDEDAEPETTNRSWSGSSKSRRRGKRNDSGPDES